MLTKFRHWHRQQAARHLREEADIWTHKQYMVSLLKVKKCGHASPIRNCPCSLFLTQPVLSPIHFLVSICWSLFSLSPLTKIHLVWIYSYFENQIVFTGEELKREFTWAVYLRQVQISFFIMWWKRNTLFTQTTVPTAKATFSYDVSRSLNLFFATRGGGKLLF